jgi:hypothetical protein
LAGAALLQGALAGPPAGPLADPTRPPAALSAPGGLVAAALPHQANRDTARAIAAAQRAAEPPPPAAPLLLQAVQLPAAGASAGTAVALVEGRLLKAGDQIDGRTVLAIDAQGVLLKGPRGPERLWLLGGTGKQAAGSITQGQTARYQATPQGPAGGADASQAQAEPRPNAPGPGAATNPTPGLPAQPGNGTDNSASAGISASNSTAPAPLSLARRTTP